MPLLMKSHEWLKFKKLLKMETGYVLNFSDKKFKVFVMDSIDKNIDDEKYTEEGSSKAKRLLTFLNKEPKYLAIELLSSLIEYGKTNNLFDDSVLYDDCIGIIDRLKQDSFPVEIDTLQKIDHLFIKKQLENIEKRMQKCDFEGAITSSFSMVETVLRFVLERNKKVIKQSERKDIQKLLKSALRCLNLDPAINGPMQRIGSGVSSIIDAIGMLANGLGDRHGKDGDYYQPQVRHAKLCANLSKIMCEFIVDEIESQKN